MADVVSEKGYAAATVADVTARAGVSRKTFYEQFEDKQSSLPRRLRRRRRGARQPPAREDRRAGRLDDRLRIGLEAFFKLLSEEPAFTRCLAIDAFAAGPDAGSAGRRSSPASPRSTGAPTRRRARRDPDIVELDLQVCRAIAGGVDEVLRGYVDAGKVADLPTIVPVMLEFVATNVARRADGTAPALLLDALCAPDPRSPETRDLTSGQLLCTLRAQSRNMDVSR